jgi:uncharacterized protein
MILATRWNYVQSLSLIGRLFGLKFLIIIILYAFFSANANAASFDCNKAISKMEKTVCANPELSKLDYNLAKAYHDALNSLSPEGQNETKQYQKQWLKKISSYTNDSGLKDAYEERIKQLQHSLIKFPDRVFRNVYVSFLKTSKSCSIAIAGDLTYPQIENPRDENEKAWNNFLFKRATDHFMPSEDCEQSNDNYAVSYSNKRLISVKYLGSTYTEGAPCPMQAAAESISWLLEAKRELQVADLFSDKTDWQNKIAALASQKLREKKIAQYLKREYPNRGIHTSEIMFKVTSPSNWVILNDGLGFGFFEVYITGFNVFIIIDWKTLDPYLSEYGRSLIHE